MPNDPTRKELARRFPGVSFGSLVQILGMDRVDIGRGSLLGDGVWLNVCTPESGSTITIGRCVNVGRGSNLNSGGRLEVADYTLIGLRVMVSNADHVTADPMRPYIDQGAVLGGATVVEENCWLGTGSSVLGDVTVERGSIVGAGAVVIRDVPPMAVVVGNPARIVRMFNPVTGAWEAASAERDRDKIENDRARSPLPDQEEYRALLRERAAIDSLDPIFAGNGLCR